MAIARDAFGAVLDVLRPGAAEIELKVAFEARMAAHGVTTPSVEGTFNSVFPGPGALAKGELVPVRAGVIADGWEGSVVATYVLPRTRPSSARRPSTRCSNCAGRASRCAT